MAETLAAVGLASNVVQFLDAAGKFLTLAHELYKSGSFSENDEIEKRTFALQSTLEKVYKRSKVQTDPRILVLVSDCSTLSHEMIEVLATLKPDKKKNRLLQVSSKSLRTVKKKEKIRDMERRLEKMRNEICAHLMVIISNNQDDLTVSVRELTDLSRTFREDNAQRFDRLDDLTQNLKEMLSCRDWANGNNAAFSKLASLLGNFDEKALESKKIIRILKSLHFSQIKERRENIREAHRKTMEWIFDPSCSANFVPWLSSSDPSASIYWVTGKPGSGKSTLMKFVEEHGKTKQYLAQGASGQRLVIATHYFWSAGTSLQKSQIGLFQTLIFQILSQCPEIIPDVVPNRWADESFASLESWSRTELLAAFKRLAAIDQQTHKIKICLFIDGLDEYDGDHEDLAKLFRSWSKSSHLKVCLSSRPWQDFIDAFGNSKWTVSVQDLTRKDIRRFIEDTLNKDSRFQELGKQDKQGADELASQIQHRAQGVFLWVFLVVRSLLRGLVNGDLMADLHRRLNELPTELEKYFDHMLRTIEPIYQCKTAQVFRVVVASRYFLPLVAFHFIDEEQSQPGYSCSGIQPLPVQDINSIIEWQRRQINASCRDLLHISTMSGPPHFENVTVGFLHRSVIDFLRTSQMDDLLSKRSSPDFNPNSSLCKAYWAMFQARHRTTEGRHSSYWLEMGEFIAASLYHAKEVEQQSGIVEDVVIYDINGRIPTEFWHALIGIQISSILDLALLFDLKLFITQHFKQMSRSAVDAGNREREMTRQLRHALNFSIGLAPNMSPNGRIPDFLYFHHGVDRNLSMVQHLLDLGADPNTKLDVVTLAPRTNSKDKKAHIARLVSQFPEDGRSVWSDYLFMLHTDFDMLFSEDEDSDSIEDSDPLEVSEVDSKKLASQKFKKGMAAEACELMIAYGADRYYQEKPHDLPDTGHPSLGRTKYLKADDALQHLFPGRAEAMIHALDKRHDQKQNEAEIEDQPSQGRCLMM